MTAGQKYHHRPVVRRRLQKKDLLNLRNGQILQVSAGIDFANLLSAAVGLSC